MIAVSEVFGPTVQGEGPSAGRRAWFLRLAGCNLACSWCDTPYAWDWKRYSRNEEERRHTVEAVAEMLGVAGWDAGKLLVVTGGEPMVQQRAVAELLGVLDLPRVEIETAGTIAPSLELASRVGHWNVSPKLESSGNPIGKRVKVALKEYGSLARSGKAALKFVVTGESDLTEAAELAEWAGAPAKAVWIMPECRTAEEHAERFPQVVRWAVERGWNASPRLHVLAWGNRRGV